MNSTLDIGNIAAKIIWTNDWLIEVKLGQATTEILLAALVIAVLLGYIFPYSVFAMATPLVVILWLIGFAGNFVVLWWWYTVPEKTKQLRLAWKPCHKTLPIEPEIFIFQQPKAVKVLILPLCAILGLIAIALLTLIPKEGLLVGVIGGLMLAISGGIVLALTRSNKDEIIATSESLTFNTSWKKATVPWSEVLSVLKITSYGIETFRVYTTKQVLTYNDRYKNYERLTELIRTALQEPDTPD